MKKNEYPDWLISLELANQLKDLGFDESCMCYARLLHTKKINSKYVPNVSHDSYSKLKGIRNSEHINDDITFGISIPTFEQAFSWFRKKGYIANIYYVFHPDLKCLIGYLYEIIYDFNWEKYSIYYISYEIAREECLKELIKIYKEKQNGRVNS